MTVRTLYLVRHGAADPLGALTEPGREQCRLLGTRLAGHSIDVVWHSPLPRAVDSAAVIAEQLPRVLVDEAPELVDHVPHLPDLGSLPPTWAAFFDGYGPEEAEQGRRVAQAVVERFATAPDEGRRDTHEVLVTHAFTVAWMVRHALGAPPRSWLTLTHIANTALTVMRFARGAPPTVVMVNDQSHLPPSLAWSGYPAGSQP